MSISKDWSISAVRGISMLFIISCHIMQYLNCELAWWFNVGVQIFLCISGYLYGQKEHIDTMRFLSGNLKKILFDYFIIIIPVSLIHLFAFNSINVKDLVFVLLLVNFLPGGEHIWFLPLILCCYFLTPFLHSYFSSVSDKKLYLRLSTLLLFTFIVCRYFVPYFNSAWISCYVLGFFLARIGDGTTVDRHISICVIILAIIFNSIRIVFQYILGNPLPTLMCEYAHALLGVSLFLILRQIFHNTKENIILVFSDKYSYCIFLVHQFLILGPLSLMGLTSSLPLNVIIILLCVFLLGVAVKKVSLFFQGLAELIPFEVNR